MNIRNGRLRTFVALGTLTALTCSTVQAGQFTAPENQLLGISLRSSTFRDVLKKYGQPDEVQGGGPFLPTPPKGVAAPAGGARGGGMPGMPSYGGMPGSGGGPSSGGGMPGPKGGAGGGGKRGYPSKNGFPGKNDGGPPAGAPTGGAPGAGGYPGGYPGAGGAPGSGGGGGRSSAGYPGYPGGGGAPGASGPYGAPGANGPYGAPGGGMPGSGGGPGRAGGKGLPGFSGPNGDTGGGPGAGAPGLPGAGEGGDQAAAGDLPTTETTWWYHNDRKGYHMSFLFNKEGRVLQIQEYGMTSLHAGKTRQGITLGSNMTQVLSRYGWSNDGAHDGENVVMRYGGADKVAFQMVKNRVLGITVAVGH